jgi:hypothetical protein
VSSFFTELKRRSVFRVGIAYLVTAWLLIQVADIVFPRIGLPDSAVTLVIALLAIGFIPALILAWAYEMTPEGVRREAEVDRSEAASQPGRKLDFAIIALLIIALGYFVWESRFSPPQIEDNIIPDRAQRASGTQPEAIGTETDRASGDAGAAQGASDGGDADLPPQNSIAILPFENISPAPRFYVMRERKSPFPKSQMNWAWRMSLRAAYNASATGCESMFSLSMHGPMSTCGPKPTIVNSAPRIYSPSRARSPPQWLMRSRRH